MTEYKKKLSAWHIWALGIGVVIADGIFIVSGQAVEQAGPAATISYLLAGIGIIFVLLALGEMCVGMPSAGAIWLWVKRLMNPYLGFMAGASYLFMFVVFMGIVGYTSGLIFTYFYQIGATPEISQLCWGVFWLTVFFIINLQDIGWMGMVELIIAILAVLGCAVFATGGFAKFDPANITPFVPFGVGGIVLAMGAGIYAFLGPVGMVVCGSEAKTVKAVPRALFWAGVTFTVMYVAIILALVGMFPQAQLGYVSPMTLAFETVFGPYAGFAQNALIVFPILGSILCCMYAGARMLKGFSDWKLLPGFFSTTNQHGTPYVGITFQYIMGIFFTIWAVSEVGMDVYMYFVLASCDFGVLCWVILVICAMRYPRRFPDEHKSLVWRIPGGTYVIPIIALIFSLFGLYVLFTAEPGAFIFAVCLDAAALLYFYFRNKKLRITGPSMVPERS